MYTFLPAATKLGQGNVFTSVYDSVHRGGVCLSACWDTTSPRPGSRHPPEQTPPPRSRPPPEQTPREQTPPPKSRHPPPGADTHHPSGSRHLPPGKRTPAYSQRAAGTHSTGMHSCSNCVMTQEFCALTFPPESSYWSRIDNMHT